MYYSESEARKAVIKAGIKLCELGLAERTWGNVSARINNEYFLITPSGRAYDTLAEGDLVRVRISDLSYEAPAVPSSEKGVHAAIYALRSDVGFIIHTHQSFATVCGIGGKDLCAGGSSILGDVVPCAGYALPSTQELMDNVHSAVERAEGCRAALMKHHGAVCFGENSEGCFEAALELERLCGEKLSSLPVTLQLAPLLGSSVRTGDTFILKCSGCENTYIINEAPADSPAAFHNEIYANSDAQYIVHLNSSAAVNISALGADLLPYVDDFAMIAGQNVLCAQNTNDIKIAVCGRSAVLLRGMGALCFGKDEADAKAVAAILEKNCLAALYARQQGGCAPISPEHAKHMRNVYLTSYSKRKDG